LYVAQAVGCAVHHDIVSVVAVLLSIVLSCQTQTQDFIYTYCPAKALTVQVFDESTIVVGDADVTLPVALIVFHHHKIVNNFLYSHNGFVSTNVAVVVEKFRLYILRLLQSSTNAKFLSTAESLYQTMSQTFQVIENLLSIQSLFVTKNCSL